MKGKKIDELIKLIEETRKARHQDYILSRLGFNLDKDYFRIIRKVEREAVTSLKTTYIII